MKRNDNYHHVNCNRKYIQIWLDMYICIMAIDFKL